MTDQVTSSGRPDPREVGPEEAVFVISIAAELADMHPQTLRGYERKGLVEPARTDGNTRRYSWRDVERLRFIQRLTQEEGLNLAGVNKVLALRDQLAQARSQVAELEERVEALADRLREEVEAAHASHRFELVPLPKGEIVLHARSRRGPVAWR